MYPATAADFEQGGTFILKHDDEYRIQGFQHHSYIRLLLGLTLRTKHLPTLGAEEVLGVPGLVHGCQDVLGRDWGRTEKLSSLRQQGTEW